ncbi:MAG: TatD family hydrolase [Pseudohongiellaceae bacterium]|nr:TatD family hydrolase [Pseudohongiellaceae bacterium]
MLESQTPNAPLVDIGANLVHESFQHDFDQVIERAKAAGLVHIMVTGTSLEGAQAALELCQRDLDYFSFTSGFHPHEASQCTSDAFSAIAELAAHDKAVAVGETGLDFNRDYSPRDAQEKAFAKHLELACNINKPMFLHQRDAHARFHPMLKEARDDLKMGGVVHCFTGEKNELFDYLDLDMYIGITGWACDERRGKHLLELIPNIPLDRLLLETDAPYLLPRTIRPKPKSRRNEPCHLQAVLTTVAQVLDLPEAQIAQQTTQNARNLFGLNF